MSNSLCGGASSGGSRSLSKILDLVSQRAFVTGEWYIPGHKLRGFLVEELESFFFGKPSNGEVKVEKMGMGLVGEELDSIEKLKFKAVLELGFSLDRWKTNSTPKIYQFLTNFGRKKWVLWGCNKSSLGLIVDGI